MALRARPMPGGRRRPCARLEAHVYAHRRYVLFLVIPSPKPVPQFEVARMYERMLSRIPKFLLTTHLSLPENVPHSSRA